MDNTQQKIPDCKHIFIPLGFDKISSDNSKVEVIACIACKFCGLFKTKMLYFDRQKYLDKKLT